MQDWRASPRDSWPPGDLGTGTKGPQLRHPGGSWCHTHFEGMRRRLPEGRSTLSLGLRVLLIGDLDIKEQTSRTKLLTLTYSKIP